jgi:hypothetical protein
MEKIFCSQHIVIFSLNKESSAFVTSPKMRRSQNPPLQYELQGKRRKKKDGQYLPNNYPTLGKGLAIVETVERILAET